MEKEAPSERLFSESEAAAILGMSPRMLADRRRARKIECVRDGRYYIRYRQRDIDGYLSRFTATLVTLAEDTSPTAPPVLSKVGRHPKKNLTPEQAEAQRVLNRKRAERSQEREERLRQKNYGLTKGMMIFLGPEEVAKDIAEEKERERAERMSSPHSEETKKSSPE